MASEALKGARKPPVHSSYGCQTDSPMPGTNMTPLARNPSASLRVECQKYWLRHMWSCTCLRIVPVTVGIFPAQHVALHLFGGLCRHVPVEAQKICIGSSSRRNRQVLSASLPASLCRLLKGEKAPCENGTAVTSSVRHGNISCSRRQPCGIRNARMV